MADDKEGEHKKAPVSNQVREQASQGKSASPREVSQADPSRNASVKGEAKVFASARASQPADINKAFDSFLIREGINLNNPRIKFLPRIVDAIFDYVRDKNIDVIDRKLLEFLLLELGIFVGEFWSNARTEFDKNRWEPLLDYILNQRKNAVRTAEPAPIDPHGIVPQEDFVRDFSRRSVVPLETQEPLPLEQPKAPAEKGAVRLEDIPYEILLAEFERRKLKAAFSASTPPTVAPKLGADTPFWKDRDTTDPRNPVEFIKDHYGKMKPDGTWDNAGLTRPHLKRDAQLYAAYATWIGRHPNDALTFAPGRNAGRYERIDNPQEFMERRRASEAQSRSKAKAGRREDTPKPG